MVSKAFFINPENEILPLTKPTHIDEILSNPDKFGETKETIENEYRKFNEPLGVEGKARNEIMIRVLQKGFIRIRETKKGWSIQTWKFDQKTNDILWHWARSVMNTPGFDKYATVYIHQLVNNTMQTKEFMSLTEQSTISEEYIEKFFKKYLG